MPRYFETKLYLRTLQINVKISFPSFPHDVVLQPFFPANVRVYIALHDFSNRDRTTATNSKQEFEIAPIRQKKAQPSHRPTVSSAWLGRRAQKVKGIRASFQVCSLDRRIRPGPPDVLVWKRNSICWYAVLLLQILFIIMTLPGQRIDDDDSFVNGFFECLTLRNIAVTPVVGVCRVRLFRV